MPIDSTRMLNTQMPSAGGPNARRSRRGVSCRRRRGYVLLLVIGVLVLMVTTLAELSQISMRRALAAADARVRLQQRIGAESLERALLKRAGSVFQTLEDQAREPPETVVPHQLRNAVTFGGVTFDVVLSDEDAKINVNQIYHATGPERMTRSLAELVGPTAFRAVRPLPAVRPNPTAIEPDRTQSSDAGEEPSEVPRAFRGWGEVFDLIELAEITGSDAALPNLTGDITCWGGGALNIRRASDPAIEAAAACVLGDAGARRLVSRYRENPNASLEILIVGEAKRETDRTKLRRMLGETSTHFSVWVDASSPARHSERSFSVTRLTDDGITLNERFSF